MSSQTIVDADTVDKNLSYKFCGWTQAFLGQKYGFRPFPPKIAASEFEAIRRELATDEGACSLLDTWFRKDNNSVPNVYVLQPISSVLPHYAEMVCRSNICI